MEKVPTCKPAMVRLPTNSTLRPESTADNNYYVTASADESCGLKTSLMLTPRPHTPPDVGVQNVSVIEHCKNTHVIT